MDSRLTFRKKQTDTAWQYKIRLDQEKKWLASNKDRFWERLDLSLKKSIIKKIDRVTASKIILTYEWLGDMAITNMYYGIFWGNYCGGVICINTNGVCPGNAKQFGIEDRDVSYFARGACAFWAPKGSASRLLSYACKLEQKRGSLVAIGFADTDAGEYGTVYQASNWICLGRQTHNSYQYVKGNKIVDSRSISSNAKRYGVSISKYEKFLENKGWLRQETNYKYRYINILASEPLKSMIYNKIKHLVSEYPKRGGGSVTGSTNDDQSLSGVRGDPTAPNILATNG